MRCNVKIFLVSIIVFFSFPLRSDAQWVQVSRLKGGWITDFAVSGTKIFVSTRKGGIFLSEDNGASWKAINSGLPTRTDFQCLALSGTNLFAGSVERGIFLSTNNGTSWKSVSSGLPAKCSVWRIVVSGTNLFVVAGNKVSSIFLSEDNGAGWKAVNQGLPDSDVLCLAVSGTNLFAGIGNPVSQKYGGVFHSTDDGASWKAVNAGLPPKPAILRFAVSGENLFAGTWSGGRVYRSKNNGTSWRAVCSGLPSHWEFSLSDFAVSGSNLFLGSFRGVYLSTSYGTSWTAINAGLPEEPSIYCLAVNEKYLFAGNEDGKVWRLPLSDLSLTANLSNPVLSEQEWAKLRKMRRKAVFIPKEIKAVMQEGLATRQGRQDIPFTIFKYLLLPAKNNPDNAFLYMPSEDILAQFPEKAPTVDSLHAVIFFKAKNRDLRYTSKAPISTPEKEQPVLPTTASVYKTDLDIFVEFRQKDESGASRVVREIFIPASIQEDIATYDPDKVNWYSIGYTLRPGKYTVVIAISPATEIKKIGVGYFDIELPGPESYQKTLMTTPVFFVKKLEQIEDPAPFMVLFKGMFTWSNILIEPNIDNVLSPGEQIEIVYYIQGAKHTDKPGKQGKCDIECTYEIQDEDGKVAIFWETQNYDFDFINQQLPLKQNIMIKDKKGERWEQRDLPSGEYYLVIRIKDKASGATAEEKVPFEIK